MQDKAADWYYLRSLTGRPFHVKHCDGCGKETDATPDPAMSFKILCGYCASKGYAALDYNPALYHAQKELEQIRIERRDIYDPE